MRTDLVVVFHVRQQYVTEMPLAEHNNMVPWPRRVRTGRSSGTSPSRRAWYPAARVLRKSSASSLDPDPTRSLPKARCRATQQARCCIAKGIPAIVLFGPSPDECVRSVDAAFV